MPIRTSPLAQFGVIDLICRCGMVGYLFRCESLGGKEENDRGTIRVIGEVHLEVAQSVTNAPIYNIDIQTSAHC
jgi:hypothetical protein